MFVLDEFKRGCEVEGLEKRTSLAASNAGRREWETLSYVLATVNGAIDGYT
jgi:hypothetical protein